MGLSSQPEAGQFLLVAVDTPTWNHKLEALTREIRPAGVLLSAGRLQSPEKTAKLLALMGKTLGGAVILGLDGPSVQGRRFGPLLPQLPSPAQAAACGLAAARRLGELHASALRMLGFNTDFGVTLDVLNSSDREPLTPCPPPARGEERRAVPRTGFGWEAAQAASCAKAFLEGLKRHGILTCASHFPGEGWATAVPGISIPLVDKPMADLWREDLLPFRELLPHLPLLSVSNAAFKAYDFDVYRPATLSESVVHGLLRVKLKYTGVAVADLRVPHEALGVTSPGEAAVSALNAGCNLLVVTERNASRSASAIEEGLQSAKVVAARVESSLRALQSLSRRLVRPSGRVSAAGWCRLTAAFERFRQEGGDPEGKSA